MMHGDEVCDELLHGMSFSVIGYGRIRGTYHVETDYGYRGDISVKDVILCEKSGGMDFFRPNHIVTGMFADVLSAPSVRSSVLMTLVRGGTVYVVGKVVDGVVQVRLADGTQGYIRTANINLIKKEQNPASLDEDSLRKSLIDSAVRYLGTQYRWGGKSPLGIDCSGLCFMAYRENGISIYRDAAIKPGYAVREIPREQMKPADLAFLPSHVAMYTGDGKFIHSSVGNNGVAVDKLEKYPVGEMVVGSVF
jgi:beta-lactamase class A